MGYASSLLYYKIKRLFFAKKKKKLQETYIAKKTFYKLVHERFFYEQ